MFQLILKVHYLCWLQLHPLLHGRARTLLSDVWLESLPTSKIFHFHSELVWWHGELDCDRWWNQIGTLGGVQWRYTDEISHVCLSGHFTLHGVQMQCHSSILPSSVHCQQRSCLGSSCPPWVRESWLIIINDDANDLIIGSNNMHVNTFYP